MWPTRSSRVSTPRFDSPGAYTPKHLAQKILTSKAALEGELRMGAGKSKAIGWMAETMAPMSVAAMGSRLFELDEERTLDAIGLAYASCSGNVQPTVEGAWSLWTPAGSAAAAGILAIDLAREGFQGPRNPLLGEFGLYRLYFRGDYDEEALLGGLGERNEIVNNSLKPYPTCKYTHHAIATTLELVRTHGLRPEHVRRVTVATNTMGATQCGFDATGAPKTTPATPGAAKFSIPFTVAAAIARGQLTLNEFTDAAIRDAGLLALAARVETRIDPAITWSDCVERFTTWAGAAVRPIARERLERFVAMVEDLESVKVAGELAPLLA